MLQGTLRPDAMTRVFPVKLQAVMDPGFRRDDGTGVSRVDAATYASVASSNFRITCCAPAASASSYANVSSSM